MARYKTKATTLTRAVFENYINPLPGVVIGSILTHQNLVKNINAQLITGMSIKVNSFFNYGRDYFTRGLPEGTLYNTSLNTDEIRSIIEIGVGSKVVILYAFMNSDYEQHYVADFLHNTRHMSPTTSLIGTNPNNTPSTAVGPIKYLSNVVVTNTSIAARRITYEYTIANGSKLTFTEDIALPYTEITTTNIAGVNTYKNNVVYQVQYQRVNASLQLVGNPEYWSYVYGTGTYPILDSDPTTTFQEEGQYYPVVPFYEDHLEIGNASNSSSALYQTSKKLVHKLGLNYKDLVQAISQVDDETVGQDKGLYAYMYLGASVTAGIPKNYATASTTEYHTEQKKHQGTIDYLIRYFTAVHNNTRNYSEEFSRTDDGSTIAYEFRSNSITITDESFNITLCFSGIVIETVVGTIGPLNWCTNSYVPTEYTTEPDVATGTDRSIVANQHRLIYSKQITQSTYLKLTVIGLYQEMLVFETTSALSYPESAFQDVDAYSIFIPLNKLLVDQTKTSLKKSLIQNSVVFLFNSYVRQKLKWYQSTLFNFIMTIINLVIAYYSFGTSLLTTAVTIIVQIALAYVIKWVYKQYGQKAAVAVAVIAALLGRNFSSITNVLFAISAVWTNLSTIIQQKYKDIQKEYLKFISETEKLDTELERAKGLLDEGMDIDPWLFINPLPNLEFSKTADQFLVAKLEMNPGVLTLYGPTNYHHLMLLLPTIDDTLTKQ
jgi:uncharacterized protein YukE